jgi:fermentation-respiration switch protein FrsA (DUF1100 family)
MLRRGLVVAAAAAAIGFAGTFGLEALEVRLVYAPDRDTVAPAEAGLAAARVLSIATEDGERLVGWFVPAGEGAALALYFHGSGGSLADRVDQIERLRSFGLAVLAIDYRGFGGSTGTPSEEGLVRDAEAAFAEARRLGWEAPRIVVVGQSLGTGVATALAARHRFAGLLLDAAFASLTDVAAERHPALPVRLVLPDRYRSDRRIAEVGAPVLLLHAEDDPVVPAHHGARLFALAAEPKQRLAVSGDRHRVLDDPRVTTTLADWFRSVTAPGP